MAEPLSLSLLKTKRKEIELFIRTAEKRLERARQDLLHLNATINMFRSAEQPFAAPAYVSLTHMFGWREMSRLCLQVVTEAPDRSATTRQIAERVVELKGWDVEDRRLCDSVCRKAIHVMHGLHKRMKKVEPATTLNGRIVWRVAVDKGG